MTDEAVEGRDAFLEKRAPTGAPSPLLLSLHRLALVNPLSRRLTEAIAMAGLRPPLSVPSRTGFGCAASGS